METAEPFRQWTVMAYMAAGDSPELDAVAIQDLREMERGVTSHANVIVQINRAWPDAPQRYEIRKVKKETRGAPDPETGQRPTRMVGESLHVGQDNEADHDMGDGKTLTRFLEWAVEHYPANYYMLVLWGHAYGLGFGRDHGDPLTLFELECALGAFETARNKAAEKLHLEQSGPVDILGANSCAMSYLEAVCQLQQRARYLVASQITVPFAGWPFDAILSSIGDGTTAESLGLQIVRNYTEALNTSLTGERVQMALLDLSRAATLPELIRELARCVRDLFIGEGQFDSLQKQVIRDTFLRTATGDVRPLIDLVNLCTLLRDDVAKTEKAERPARRAEKQQRAEVSSRNDKLSNLSKACDALLLQVVGDPGKATAPSALVVKSLAHPSLSDLNGVGIFAPFVTDEHDLKRLELEDVTETIQARNGGSVTTLATNRESYENLALFADPEGKHGPADEGGWPTLVYDDLNEPVPEELMNLVLGVGVQRTSDRADIVQIILAIESSFNRLDRLLDRAREAVLAKVNKNRPDKRATVTSAAREFGRLRLLRPLDMKLAVAALELRASYQKLMGNTGASLKIVAAGEGLIKESVDWLLRLEDIVQQIEIATHKALTHTRFGLGPAEVPAGFDLDQPRNLGGGIRRTEPPKPGEGPPSDDVATTTPFRQAEIGTLQVRELFGRVASVLGELEGSIATLELQVREVLTGGRQLEDLSRQQWQKWFDKALESDVGQAFAAMCESAINARRTIRRVVADPLYGLGPSASAFALDAREELAFAAGFSQTRLRLLIPHFRATGSNR